MQMQNADCRIQVTFYSLYMALHLASFLGPISTSNEAQLRRSSTGTPIARCNMTRVCCWKYTQTYTVSSAAGAMRLKRGMSRKMPGCLRLQSTGVMLVAAIKLETGRRCDIKAKTSTAQDRRRLRDRTFGSMSFIFGYVSHPCISWDQTTL